MSQPTPQRMPKRIKLGRRPELPPLVDLHFKPDLDEALLKRAVDQVLEKRLRRAASASTRPKSASPG